MVGHFVGVAEQPKAGDVGHGVGVGGLGSLGGGFVEGFHAGNGRLHMPLLCNPLLQCRCYYPYPKWFGQQQHIARLRSALRFHLVGVDNAGHGHTVFWFFVSHAVAASNHPTRLGYLFCSAAQNLAQNLLV